MTAALSPFSSPAHLRQCFVDGLDSMLAQYEEELGVTILVLANAAQDPTLWPPLRNKLLARYQQHAKQIKTALRSGSTLKATEDDLMVLLKLMAMELGQDSFDLVQVRPCRLRGPWEVQLNPLRALRPARMSQARAEGNMRPFDPNGFHFNKPFLAKEILWQGELNGKNSRLLYNKFPFAPLHGLLVPEPELAQAQFLSAETHAWAWQVAREAGTTLPGFGLAYNSYGAYASVNHLHFQTFVRTQPLPVQKLEAARYPLPVLHFAQVESAWTRIDQLHQLGKPYNLIYDVHGVHVIARARQGEVALQDWSPGFAWSEMAGVFSVGSAQDYHHLTETVIEQALAEMGVED